MDLEDENEETLFALLSSQNEDAPVRFEDVEESEDREDCIKAIREELKIL